LIVFKSKLSEFVRIKNETQMKINSTQIQEIIDGLLAGDNVYINKETLEIANLPDIDDLEGDTELWEQEITRIESEWSDYALITRMESKDGFKVMADFTDIVDDIKLKEDLIRTLNRKGPFANFKAVVESSDYKQKWFDFRNVRYEEYVKEQLEIEDIEFE
jgi:hypothetical protein